MEAMTSPRGWKLMLRTPETRTCSCFTNWPSGTLHTRMVRSPEAEATRVLSRLKARLWTGFEWPSRARTGSAPGIRQSTTVLSSDADANSFPSGLKATSLHDAESFAQTCRGMAPLKLQSAMPPSLPIARRDEASGLMATLWMKPCWFLSVNNSRPSAAFQTWMEVRLAVSTASFETSWLNTASWTKSAEPSASCKSRPPATLHLTSAPSS